LLRFEAQLPKTAFTVRYRTETPQKCRYEETLRGWSEQNDAPGGEIMRAATRCALQPSGSPDVTKASAPNDSARALLKHLPFTVELWNRAGTVIDRTLGMTSDITLGYSTYLAAIKAYPDRPIVYRSGKRVIARSGFPEMRS
jgi:hypothetical protein